MARIKAGDIVHDADSNSAESEEDEVTNTRNVMNSSTGALQQDFGSMEQEYHTEDSEDAETDIQEIASNTEESRVHGGRANLPTNAPLLPAELLKPLPSPAHSLWDGINIPWNQMTPEQKRAERLRSRRAAKREWDAMQESMDSVQDAATQSGALDAGKMAQRRRTKSQPLSKTKSGRVTKGTRLQISGRDRLLQTRKKLVERNSQTLKPSKRRRKKKALPKR